MKHYSIIFTFITLLLTVAACSPRNLSYIEAQQRNDKKLDSEAQRSDATFLVEATNYLLLFNELSEKAVQDGYARVVVDFANMSLADHRKMREDIKDLAKKKKFSLPATKSDRYQDIFNELSRQDRRSFDKTYLNTVESLHERAIRLFEDAALKANDNDVRAYAAARLDVLRNHERQADQIEDQLL